MQKQKVKVLLRNALSRFGWNISRVPRPTTQIPDSQYYRPLFSPWLGYGEFQKYYDLARSRTLVSPDRCWILYSLCKQSLFVEGDIWECGVYRGGTSAMLAQIVHDYSPARCLHLFDTFHGMPKTYKSIDIHNEGDFSNTTLNAVRDYVKHSDVTIYHQGLIPDTFRGLDNSLIAFAHIDVDILQSVTDCCEFIFPMLSVGGFMVFDDYGFPSCPGARKAVDEYFYGRDIVPLILPTGQAVVFKSR